MSFMENFLNSLFLEQQGEQELIASCKDFSVYSIHSSTLLETIYVMTLMWQFFTELFSSIWLNVSSHKALHIASSVAHSEIRQNFANSVMKPRLYMAIGQYRIT